MTRLLHVVVAPTGPPDLHTFLDQLAAALDGTGPALLPVPESGPEVALLLDALDPTQPLEDDETALVVPTSGSTGVPKGVLLTASALTASATATHDRLGGTGRWLLALPATHVAGIQVLVRSLLAETDPACLPPGPFTAEAFVSATAELGPGRRYTSLVPTQLGRLLAGGPAATQALASYDAVLVGGAAAPTGLLADARQQGARLVTTYGMSETCGGCVYDGVALDGVVVDVRDDGRIRLAGPVLARGYRLRPDLTAEAFADGWFTTSDLGRLGPDAPLTVLGRADDVIVSGGENIVPASVELALVEHPSVAEVAVVAAPDAEWGQRVVAVVRLRAGAHLTLQEAREHVAARLPRSAAPRELLLVDALPLLGSGKTDRALLQARVGGRSAP